MSKQSYLLFLIIPLLSSCIRSGNKIGADDYTDSVLFYNNQLLCQIDTFFQSLYYPDYDAVEYYWKTVKQVQISREKLTRLGDFKSDEQLYNEGLNFYNTMDNLLAEEGKKLLELHEFRNTYSNLMWRKEMDSLIRISYQIVNNGQHSFDETLTNFLNQHGFDVIMDTGMISKSNFEDIPEYTR